jgi:hypothetical protein
MVCYAYLVELQFHSVLGWHRQALQAGSLSMNYGRFKTSEMLAGLVLLFSILHFSFYNTGGKKQIKGEGDSFPVGTLAAVAGLSAGPSLMVMCYKMFI